MVAMIEKVEEVPSFPKFAQHAAPSGTQAIPGGKISGFPQPIRV